MEETPDRSGNSGMSGLKVVFFFPLLPEEDIIKVVVDFFLVKSKGEAGKKGFQPMRKKLGKKFGVVFTFAEVVTDTELCGIGTTAQKGGVNLWKLSGGFSVQISMSRFPLNEG